MVTLPFIGSPLVSDNIETSFLIIIIILSLAPLLYHSFSSPILQLTSFYYFTIGYLLVSNHWLLLFLILSSHCLPLVSYFLLLSYFLLWALLLYHSIGSPCVPYHWFCSDIYPHALNHWIPCFIPPLDPYFIL